MQTPTQGTPGGCFLGTIAFFPAAICAFGFCGLYKWLHLPDHSRHFDNLFWLFAGSVLLGALFTLGILVVTIRVIRSTDFRGYDSRDPDQRGLKW